MQDQDQVIEMHDLLKPDRQVMEQRVQIPVGEDSFRNRQQGAVLLAGGKHGHVSWDVIHVDPLLKTIRPGRDYQCDQGQEACRSGAGTASAVRKGNDGSKKRKTGHQEAGPGRLVRSKLREGGKKAAPVAKELPAGVPLVVFNALDGLEVVNRPLGAVSR